LEQAVAHRVEEALARSARGDPSGFEDIVREHQAMVFSLAYHFLHDRSQAEELAQDVFLQLYQRLPAIESAAHLRFWLCRVTSHRCIDEVRRRRPQVSLEETAEPSTTPSLPDPILNTKLRQLVATLPERQRLVVILRYQEELELHEIAETLEMPLNTVKSSLQRAHAVLREKLARCLGDVPA
jgi:RNA polymerase sigma-70 factor, ECF subfamily